MNRSERPDRGGGKSSVARVPAKARPPGRWSVISHAHLREAIEEHAIDTMVGLLHLCRQAGCDFDDLRRQAEDRFDEGGV